MGAALTLDQIVASYLATFGGSWDQWERDLDMKRIKALQDELRQRPSVQSMVQAYLGIEPSVDGPPPEQSDEDIEAEFAALARRGLMG